MTTPAPARKATSIAHPAFSAWDLSEEASLEEVEQRIHGGASDLRRRAKRLLNPGCFATLRMLAFSCTSLLVKSTDGVGVDLLDIQEGRETIWACFSEGGDRRSYREDLPGSLFVNRRQSGGQGPPRGAVP
jgi:hypothetical protein